MNSSSFCNNELNRTDINNITNPVHTMIDISLDKSPQCNFHPRDDQRIHLNLSVASEKEHCLCMCDKGNCRESAADFGAKTDKCESPVPLDLLHNSVFYGSSGNSQGNFYFGGYSG